MHDMSAHAVHHGAPTSFIRKHVFSIDHKVIGKQYYALALVAVVWGMVLSWIMRIHLGWGNYPIPGLHLLSSQGAPGNVMTPEYYLQLMTMHGTIMVFFVLTTAPFAAFGNFFLPIQVGAEDMPFPHFNMMSFWVTFVAFLVLVSSFFVGEGPTLGGWTQYAPLSAVGSVSGPGQGLGVVLWAAAIGIFCIGQLLGSLNFITTTLDMRTRGHVADASSPERLGMVHYFGHGLDRLCGSHACLHPADPGPRCRNIFLRAFEPGDQWSVVTPLRRIDAALATLVLVLRTS